MEDSDGSIVATSPGIYGLEHNARALAPLPPRESSSDVDEDDISLFLVGSHSASAENMIHLLEYNDDTEDITSRACPFSQGEIWSIATSTQATDLFAMVSGPSHNKEAAVFSYKVDADDALSITRTCTLRPAQAEQTAYTHMECGWHPDEAERVCVACNDNTLACWDVKQQKQTFHTSLGNESQLTAAVKWSPHHSGNVIGAAFGDSVYLQDTAANTVALRLPAAHLQGVRAIDFNPNKQYVMATGGDDGCVRIWDTRHATKPLLIQRHHSHWVWSVHYNPFYDRLVLTSGSDGQVLLNNVATSSSDMGATDGNAAGDGDSNNGQDAEDDGDDDDDQLDENREQRHMRERMKTDCLLARYEDHEDSVYSACWSQMDAWTLASLSFDGRVLVSKVPSSIKFSILL